MVTLHYPEYVSNIMHRVSCTQKVLGDPSEKLDFLTVVTLHCPRCDVAHEFRLNNTWATNGPTSRKNLLQWAKKSGVSIPTDSE